MDKKKLKIDIGDIKLKNPIICGSAEHFIEKAGIMNAINMGAAAVVAKSSNESNVAKIQLDKTDYSLIDSKLDNINWNEKKDIDTSLFGRSGLIQLETEEWLNKISILDNEAAKENAFVIASLIPSDLDCLIKYAEIANNLGIRILEVNIGAPHGVELDEEIKIIRKEDIVKEIVKNVRDVFKGSLWIKIAGVTENVIEISAASKEQGADAVVMIGRMMAMIPDIESMDPILGTNGAYGGRWALPITCRWLSETRKMLGNEYPLIGIPINGYSLPNIFLVSLNHRHVIGNAHLPPYAPFVPRMGSMDSISGIIAIIRPIITTASAPCSFDAADISITFSVTPAIFIHKLPLNTSLTFFTISLTISSFLIIFISSSNSTPCGAPIFTSSIRIPRLFAISAYFIKQSKSLGIRLAITKAFSFAASLSSIEILLSHSSVSSWMRPDLPNRLVSMSFFSFQLILSNFESINE